MNAQTSDAVLVELRCPLGAKKLLAKVRSEGDRPRQSEGNLLELSCRDCSVKARKEGYPHNTRVLHRFNLAGELVESVAERF